MDDSHVERAWAQNENKVYIPIAVAGAATTAFNKNSFASTISG